MHEEAEKKEPKYKLVIYVIYEDPKDYPGQFVVRRWVGLEGDKEPLIITPSLLNARAAIPNYTTPIGRAENDDACIKEVWI